ncbi:hypothetical protein FAI40_04305 [Acetobacteraceae bacterium]|nr:hypothetical protein FAI40_04305 [Acetobacteraceae bacterium]
MTNFLPHFFSAEWVNQHEAMIMMHAAGIQIISSVLQSVSGVATLFVMGGIMWMQVRAQQQQVSLSEKTHAVTEQTYRVAQIQKDMTHSQYETSMIQIRWNVWRSYDSQVSEVLNQIRSVLQGQSDDRDEALDIYSQLHSAGYQLVWTFGAQPVGEQVSEIDSGLGVLLRAVCVKANTGRTDLNTSFFLSSRVKDQEVTQEQIDLWKEYAPRITSALDKIVQNIGPFMQIKDPFLVHQAGEEQPETDGEENMSDAPEEIFEMPSREDVPRAQPASSAPPVALKPVPEEILPAPMPINAPEKMAVESREKEEARAKF